MTSRWREAYPIVSVRTCWKFRLEKNDNFVCNLVGNQISGATIDAEALSPALNVTHRFVSSKLNTFVLPDAADFYFETETENERNGLNQFIEYLTIRERSGLAFEGQGQRRYIFVQPCEFTRRYINYQGNGLLGIVQNAYPPLNT